MKNSVWLLLICSIVLVLTACSGKASENDKVIIYSNADEEAITAMEQALKDEGLSGKYIIQSMGTSELGGKMIAEGNKIEADVVTMASYFIDSAQKKNNMFTDIKGSKEAIDSQPSYALPILGNMGAIFVNTEVLKQKKLDTPTSIVDLTKPEYKDLVSIPNIMDSSTGWLLIQAILHQYGEEKGKEVLHNLLANVGPHLESSGSGPIKKVQTGEVAVGFGLRAQAVNAKVEGQPIQYIDPTEGNFSLTESVAVVNKGGDKQKLAMKIAKVIADKARPALLKQYPVALYKGETVAKEHEPKHATKWETPLTVDLLEQHQAFFKSAQ
ncbi:extracellular solute-binding protein [Rummeliibacillus pycnus]|uniref:extracellular solute-binding protein n=1 Tax=Rummeliibacillus pycnus TaxID=101070 RepID=UPI000C9B67B1